jgi:hypothetical protein
MKNPGKSLRKLYAAALANLTYDGKSVTVYDSYPIETTPDRYVYINAMTYAQVGNNNAFIFDGSVTLDIVCKQYKKIDYDTIDGIATEVLNTLLPFPYSQQEDTDFQFMNPQLSSVNYLIEPDGSYFILRKIIILSQAIFQK